MTGFKGFEGLGNLYQISDPLDRRPYRGRVERRVADDALWRGDVVPNSPTRIEWASGAADPGDVVHTTSGRVVALHARVLDALEAAGVTGWRTYPVEVVNRRGLGCPDYQGWAVVGRCGDFHYRKAQVVLVEYPCGWLPELRVWQFEPTSWTGHDLFLVGASARLLGTERARAALSTCCGGALEMVPLRDLTIRPDRVDDPSLLPGDVKAQIDRAYELSGHPRPDLGGTPPAPDRRGAIDGDRPLEEDDQWAVEAWVRDALVTLDVDQTASPDRIVAAIVGRVEDLRPMSAAGVADEGLRLGALFGAQIVRVTGWSWVVLTAAGEDVALGVVPKDRAVCVAPQVSVHEALQDATDLTSLGLMFRMIEAKRLPAAAPATYCQLG